MLWRVAGWPLLRQESPDASFAIYGYRPTPAAEALAGRDGIELVANLRIELLSAEFDQQRQLAAIERLIGGDL